MRLHRFFIEHHIHDETTLLITDSLLINQLKNVFRLKAPDRVILLDNSGFEFEAEIETLSREDARFIIKGKREAQNVPKKEIFLLCSLIKKDNFEWILEKGTELGVNHFVPVLSGRSEKKNLNIDRAKKILREASEQSGRGKLPDLHPVVAVEDIFAEYMMPLVAFHPEGEGFSKEKIEENQVGILIGPEGGWNEQEIRLFKEKGVQICSLGTQILRAETAAIAASALMLL